MNSSYIRVLLLILLGVALTSTLVVGEQGYALTAASSQDAVEIPTRTIDNSYGSATIDSVSTVSGGDSVTVETTVEAGKASPDLQIRDGDNTRLALRRDVESGEYTFDSSVFVPGGESEVTAGTYVATLLYDNEVVAAHPIVIQGYDISVTPPEDPTMDSPFTIQATISERAIPKNSAFKEAEVIIGNEDVEKRATVTDTNNDGVYTTEITTDGLESISYNVYVVVRGDETTQLDSNEILGISDVVTLSLGDSGSESDTDQSTDDDQNTGGSAPGGTQPTEKEQTTNETEPTDNSTQTEPVDNSTVNDTQTEPVNNSSVDGENTESATDDGSDSVIQPTDDAVGNTSPPDDTDAAGQTNDDTSLSLGVVVVALLSSALIAVRRCQ